jgi:predicted HAD superfamily phosphohydrolase YqeG
VQYDGWKVDDEFIEWFASLRSRGVERIIITTNKAAKDEADVVQLQAWAEQVGADALISPMNASQRKPSPYMLLAAMQHFEIGPETMVSVGDKLHGDVLAANLAKVHSVYVTEPHGASDHPGDKFIKRPFIEKPIHKLVRGKSPQVKFEDKPEGEIEPVNIVKQNPKAITIDSYIMEKGLVIGYATEPIHLRPEYLAKLPPPQLERFRALAETIIKAASSSTLLTAYKEYLREHGEDHAEFLTDLRKQTAPIPGALAALGMNKAAAGLYTGEHITDGLDGFAIRMSGADLTTERRKKGAVEDREADQQLTNYSGWGVVLGGYKDPINQQLQSLRVPLRNRQVAKAAAEGFDIRSDRYSKVANEFLGVADFLSLLTGKNPATFTLQSLATYMKYDSMMNSEKRIWPYRKARLQAAKEVLAQLKQTS